MTEINMFTHVSFLSSSLYLLQSEIKFKKLKLIYKNLKLKRCI